VTCKPLGTRLRPLLTFLGAFLVAASLAACGAGSGASAASPQAAQSPPPPPQSLSGDAWQGRYVGIVSISGTNYFGDALLTADGAMRLYVGGPYSDSGALQQGAAAGSMQLVGTLAAAPQGHAAGQGIVLGEGCAGSSPGRFCQQVGSAGVDVTIASGDLEGQVSVTSVLGSESWSLKLSPWTNYYILPALPGDLTGTYKEQLAEFAVAGDTLINIQADGMLSFSSPHSGCAGSGWIGPHRGTAVAANVYDVRMTVSGCSVSYSYLNGDYAGLATTTPSSAWDYDSLLRMWLSQDYGWEGAAPALTTLATPQ
jgi:hypothetical protein